jgi:hypothetical protein
MILTVSQRRLYLLVLSVTFIAALLTTGTLVYLRSIPQAPVFTTQVQTKNSDEPPPSEPPPSKNETNASPPPVPTETESWSAGILFILGMGLLVWLFVTWKPPKTTEVETIPKTRRTHRTRASSDVHELQAKFDRLQSYQQETAPYSQLVEQIRSRKQSRTVL